jgi:cold shock CspA family protein
MENKPEVGTIVCVIADRGFGFVRVTGESEDLFFHAKDLTDGLVFSEQLQELRVTFQRATYGGRERARNIKKQ